MYQTFLRLLRFTLSFFGTLLACAMIALVIWLLRQWWLSERGRPSTLWNDTTVERNDAPVTPGTGSSASQKVWIY